MSARREFTIFALTPLVVGSSLNPTDVRDLGAPIRRQRQLFHVVIYLLFFLDGTPDSTPHSILTPTHLPQVTSPGAAVPHVPMTLPRVPAHVFSGQHVLSASKFNREQVNRG